MSLSERIRPGVEAAPWVIEEVRQLEQEHAELTMSYHRLMAQREELYRQLNGVAGEKTQHCTSCKRSLPLDRFDASERPTRQGVVYTCRQCLGELRPVVPEHGAGND